MLEEYLERLIKSNPIITRITNRGLETDEGKCFFVARNLRDRCPKLVKLLEPQEKSKSKKNKTSQ